MQLFRQGDVLIIPSKLPDNAVVKKDTIVAYGEVSGHHHQFTSGATVYTAGAQMFAVIEQGAVLQHQEHAKIEFEEPGVYEILIQREYDYLGHIRKVMD